jgi:WD40 repeat protein
LALSPIGNLLASGSLDKTIKIWNFEKGKVVKTLTGHDKKVNSVIFSKNGSYITSGSEDKKVKHWNAETGLEEKTFLGHN